MKGISKKRLLLMLSALCLLGACVFFLWHRICENRDSDSTETSYAWFQKTGKLVVVTDYSPLGYCVNGDTIEGFSYELIQLLQTYTDIRFEIELESSLQKSIEGLESGKYNIIARNIPVTTELKKILLFTDPITQSKQVLVQRKQEYDNDIPPIRSHLELAGKTLYVSKNSPAILRIKNLSMEIGDEIHYIEDEEYGDEQLAIMVAEGEIDFAVCDERNAGRIAKVQPELDIETLIGFTQFEAWGTTMDNSELMDSLNFWLKEAKETPKFRQIYNNYY